MKSTRVPLLTAACLLVAVSQACTRVPPASVGVQGTTEDGVAATLDALHEAASQADGDRYFALFAEEGVFLGTDATERWTVEQFRGYAMPHFSQGRGWTYEPTERNIRVSSDGNTAWFDERLQNAGLGETRGSGVLVWRDGAWKIAQYNLTIPIPNALAGDVVRQIRELAAAPGESAP